MPEVRVLVADDDAVVREALGALISAEESLELVALAAGVAEAVELAERHQPDVAVVDVRMPSGGGFAATRGIYARSPQTAILALSADGDRKMVVDMLRAGATGYVVKGSSGAEIVSAILSTARGESFLSTEIAGEVVGELTEALAREQRELELHARRAERIRSILEPGALQTVFQPIVDLRTGHNVGLEALTRVAVAGREQPAPWFAEAEAVGLGRELETRAAEEALSHLDSVPDDCFIAINLSPSSIDGWCHHDATGAGRCDRIVIEITEHARVDDYEALERELTIARAAGVRIAVDDVGAGFASLHHILNLGPDFIKIDRSLTREVHADRGRRALAKALIAFGAELGSIVVAEGIETRKELETLRDLGVTCGQGFYIARPQPLAAILEQSRADVWGSA